MNRDISFNEFLVAEEGRCVLHREQADTMAERLRRHGVVIRVHQEFWGFVKAHPEYVRVLTKEDLRQGMQSHWTMWSLYISFQNFIPQRNWLPSGRGFVETPWPGFVPSSKSL